MPSPSNATGGIHHPHRGLRFSRRAAVVSLTIYHLARIFDRPVLLTVGLPTPAGRSRLYGSPRFDPVAGEPRGRRWRGPTSISRIFSARSSGSSASSRTSGSTSRRSTRRCRPARLRHEAGAPTRLRRRRVLRVVAGLWPPGLGLSLACVPGSCCRVGPDVSPGARRDPPAVRSLGVVAPRRRSVAFRLARIRGAAGPRHGLHRQPSDVARRHAAAGAPARRGMHHQTKAHAQSRPRSGREDGGYIAGEKGVDLVREVAARIAAGQSLLIFPEGTRTATGATLGPLKPVSR